MSRFGDDREFMNDLSEALEKRAEKVGNAQAISEMLEVVKAHCDIYWAEEQRNGD